MKSAFMIKMLFIRKRSIINTNKKIPRETISLSQEFFGRVCFIYGNAQAIAQTMVINLQENSHLYHSYGLESLTINIQSNHMV